MLCQPSSVHACCASPPPSMLLIACCASPPQRMLCQHASVHAVPALLSPASPPCWPDANTAISATHPGAPPWRLTLASRPAPPCTHACRTQDLLSKCLHSLCPRACLPPAGLAASTQGPPPPVTLPPPLTASRPRPPRSPRPMRRNPRPDGAPCGCASSAYSSWPKPSHPSPGSGRARLRPDCPNLSKRQSWEAPPQHAPRQRRPRLREPPDKKRRAQRRSRACLRERRCGRRCRGGVAEAVGGELLRPRRVLARSSPGVPANNDAAASSSSSRAAAAADAMTRGRRRDATRFRRRGRRRRAGGPEARTRPASVSPPVMRMLPRLTECRPAARWQSSPQRPLVFSPIGREDSTQNRVFGTAGMRRVGSLARRRLAARESKDVRALRDCALVCCAAARARSGAGRGGSRPSGVREGESCREGGFGGWAST
eukprot:352466-Chlamydomonas_euryale.AAC.1